MNGNKETPFSMDLLVEARLAAVNVHEYLALSSEVENLIDASAERIRRSIDAELATFSEREREELSEQFFWDVRQYEGIFPSMHRQAMFVALYNHLEYNLNVLCGGIGKELNSNIQLRHLQGRGVKRALLFLDCVAAFDLSAASGAIQFIERANELRNAVVHNGGVLRESAPKAVTQLLDEEPSLSGAPGKYINFEHGFFPLFGHQVKVLFEETEREMYRFMGDENLPAREG